MKRFIYIILAPALIILIAVLIRLFPHAPNFVPIAAMALFAGAYISKKYSMLILFVTLLISDYLLLYVNPFSSNPINFGQIYSPLSLIHSTTGFVYGSFLLIGLIGFWLNKRVRASNLILASLSSSILFFVITNAGVWIMGGYARDLSGLWQSYLAGLPFFRNTVLSDLLYVSVFFGAFEFVKKYVLEKKLATQK